MKRLEVGDRVAAPAIESLGVSAIGGVVIETGYTDFVKVLYDDGVIGLAHSDDLERAKANQ